MGPEPRHGVRRPAVAGSFYPDEPRELRRLVEECLGPEGAEGPAPKALIVPHAGLLYSGPVAGSGYRRLRSVRAHIRRVVLLGPAHRHPLRGLAVSGADAFRTPLGDVRVASDARARALALPHVRVVEAAHAWEHSLEVHLPFLQVVLADFDVVPLVVGEADADDVAAVLDALWGGEETLVVVSTDLSHGHPAAEAKSRDARTARAVVALRGADVDLDDACGALPLRGLLAVARRRGLCVETLDLRTSADTAGDGRSVVGYGAFALWAPPIPGRATRGGPRAACG